MARHRKYEAPEDEQPALEISSLIDVCFLLLIYFLVTSTINPRETDLGMALPTSIPDPNLQPIIDPLFIRIDSNGLISTGIGSQMQPLDSDPAVREVPQLRAQLDLYASGALAANQTPLVQVYAEGEASHQRVIDVLNALAAVNISSVTFTDLVD